MVESSFYSYLIHFIYENGDVPFELLLPEQKRKLRAMYKGQRPIERMYTEAMNEVNASDHELGMNDEPY